MDYNVTVSSGPHTIDNPLENIKVGDVVRVFNKDEELEIEILLTFDNSSANTDCSLCPLFGNKICQYHWEDENGVLHGLCESRASTTDPNAKDIRFDSFGRIMTEDFI